MNCLWMYFVCLLLSSQPILSFVSVVFVFSESLNDVVPVLPIMFPVVKIMEKRELLIVFFGVSSFICLHHSD